MYPLFVHENECKSNAYLLPIYHLPTQHWYMYICANNLSNNFVFLCGHTLIKCICRSGIQPTTFQIWKQLIDQRSSLLNVTLAPHKKKNIFFGSWGKHNQEKATQEATHSSQIFALLYRETLIPWREKKIGSWAPFLLKKRKMVGKSSFWRKEKW